MNYPRVAIIILNWNGWADTLECLESVSQINYLSFDVIVIDNNSHDSSIEKIREYCKGNINVKSTFFTYEKNNKPIKLLEYTNKELKSFKTECSDLKDYSNITITLIKNDKNYGFANGNNIGMDYAIKTLNSDYLLLLNNDTVVDKDFLTEMVNVAIKGDNIGFVGPKVYIYDNKNTLQVAGGAKVDLKYGEIDEIAYHQLDNGEFDHYIEPDYIGGTCVLCKKDVIKEIGMLDPTYFMYWEDADWCFRGRKYGYKSVYAFKSKIWHKYGASSDTPFKMYYFTRNRIYFMRKNVTRGQFIQFSMFLAAVTFYKCLYHLIYRRDLKMSKSLLTGFIDGLAIHKNKNI